MKISFVNRCVVVLGRWKDTQGEETRALKLRHFFFSYIFIHMSEYAEITRREVGK